MRPSAQRSKIYIWFVSGFLMPPPMWLFICWFCGLWDTQTLFQITLSPLLAVYVAGYLACVVFILHRHLAIIDNFQSHPGGDDLSTIQTTIGRLPLMYMSAQAIYCIIGPNSGLVAHRFTESRDYVLSWMVAMPIIMVYSVPFLFQFTKCIEHSTAHVPLPAAKPALSTTMRFYIVSLSSTVGTIIILLLFIYSLLYKTPNIALDQLMSKLVIMGIISLCSVVATILPFARKLSMQSGKMVALATAIGEGDLRKRVAVAARDETGLLAQSLNNICELMGKSIGHVAQSSHLLAEGAAKQAASVEETSSSLEEMSSMTRRNSDDARQADIVMKNVNQAVSKANLVMSELITSMQDISKATEKTFGVVKNIDEIAFQTNLLALNAAVEAARAGEAGSGFSVVADEVRSLASRAAAATKETTELINGIVMKVREGAALVNKTSETFTQVTTHSSKVDELVGKIAAGSNEQAQGIEQINKAMVQIDTVVQKSAANAEALAASTSTFKISESLD